MKPSMRWILFGLLLVALVGLSEPPGELTFAITGISVQNTNLLISARIPAGLERVALEGRTAVDSPWLELRNMTVSGEAQNLSFVIPKPDVMYFYRVSGIPTATNVGPMVSSELRYVAIQPLGSTDPSATDAVFHFKGLVDGCDKIVITREGALWQHVNWDWPQGPVSINGVQWDPRQKNYLAAIGGTKLLPDRFDLEGATLEPIEGRDIVAMERGQGALTIWLNDVPPGFGSYEFKVHFPAAQPTPVRVKTLHSTAVLKISAQIDGSDVLKITPEMTTWQHLTFGCPDKVAMNNITWSVQETNVLANDGATRFLPAGVDLSSAQILSRKGRDLVTMSAQKDAVLVSFADNPNGADQYEIEIAFDAP